MCSVRFVDVYVRFGVNITPADLLVRVFHHHAYILTTWFSNGFVLACDFNQGFVIL